MPPIDDAMVRRFYRDVGSRVRTARTGANLTQDELAELVDVARSSIANLEAGRQRIPLHLFALIAEKLGVPATELFPRRSILEQVDDFFNVDEKLADADDSRDFVTGAIAQLLAKPEGDDAS
jgi:transcriptional regulator with XRE-family HTH domain